MKGLKTLHRQVVIRYQRGSAEVDEGIAPLILALWRRGFRTVASCEGEPVAGGQAYVAFKTLDEAKRFQRISRGLLARVTAEDLAGAYNADVVPVGTAFVIFADVPAVVKRLATRA